MDQTRDIAPALERTPLPSSKNSQWSDRPIKEEDEIRVASLEERFANWGTD